MTAFGAIGQFPVGGSPFIVTGATVTKLRAISQVINALEIDTAQIASTLPTLGATTVQVISVTEFFDSSGHIELLLSSVAGLSNGSTITVRNCALEPLANGTWTITLPFGNFVDLVGSPAPNNTGPTSSGTATWGPGPSQTLSVTEIEPARITTTLQGIQQLFNGAEILPPAQISTTLRAFTQALDVVEIDPTQIVTTLQALTQALDVEEIEPAQIVTALRALAQAIDAIEIDPVQITTTLPGVAQRLDAITIPPVNPVSIETTLLGLAQVLRARTFKVARGVSVFGYAGDDGYGHVGGGSGYID